jgi:hypothetical protein
MRQECRICRLRGTLLRAIDLPRKVMREHQARASRGTALVAVRGQPQGLPLRPQTSSLYLFSNVKRGTEGS